LFLLTCSASALGQANLPQSKEKVVLTGAVRKALEAGLTGPSESIAGTSRYLPLSAQTAALIVQSLPKSFRDSCAELVDDWREDTKGTAQWSVRVLFSSRDERGTDAVLALSCGSKYPGMAEWYDERPAVVVLTPESATLRIVPLAPESHNSGPFYHLAFSKTYAAVGARLVELAASYSGDNPCCDGTDHQSGDRFVVLSLPDAEQVLSLDKGTYANSEDDADETSTEWVCEAKIDYDRDAADNLETIRAETRCTVNKEPQPDVKKQSFHWSATAHRFEELKDNHH
jgi:hypothetical protein